MYVMIISRLGASARRGGRPFLHLYRSYFAGLLALALIFPRAIMKPPFNIHHLPLRKLRVTVLSQHVPRNDGMPGRLVVVSSALIFPVAFGCHGKGRHGCAVRGIV